jgi:S1-C subfamily serine protease
MWKEHEMTDTLSLRTKPKTTALNKMGIILLAILLSLVGIMVPAKPAHADTPEVVAARDGVYLIKVYYETSNGEDRLIGYGSCFFINDEDLLTCNRVIGIDANQEAWILATYDDADYRDHIVYKVALMRDLEVEASLNRASVGTDFAIMRLQETIAPPVHLVLGSSEDVAVAQNVWTLGFPDEQIDFTNLTPLSFTASDVTVGSGTVSKLVDMDNTNFIQHNAPMSVGNEGGPLLDDDGIVVGINARLTDVPGGDYNHSISIDQVKTALDKLAISYDTPEDDPNKQQQQQQQQQQQEEEKEVSKEALVAAIAEAEAQAGNLSGYTTETATAFTSALSVAKSVNSNEQATQEQVDKAISDLRAARNGLIENPSLNPLIIGGIIAAIVVIIIVIVLLVVLRSRKKKKAAVPPAPPLGAHAVAGPGMPPPPAPNFGGGTTTGAPSPSFPSGPMGGPATAPPPVYQPPTPGFDSGGGGDTTVLNPAVGETSLLGASQMAATLIRISNNERVRINRPEFIIGKERRKVNFVIPDNSAVSRTHARITQRDGQFYITDLNTTNFTFVNDKKIPANTETPLNKGDRIKLADEEFEFDV